MSVVDFSKHLSGMVALDLGPLIHSEVDCLLEPLNQAERRDVRSVLELVTRKLATASTSSSDMRIRLDAVIGALIGVADAIDGDPDLEPYFAGGPCGLDEAEPDNEGEHHTAIETHGRGFGGTPAGGHDDDEGDDREGGATDDNGIADADGLDEQISCGHGLL